MNTPKPLPMAHMPLSITAGPIHSQLSVFDLFRIGIGPSSSHTVGPMQCGLHFATQLQSKVGVSGEHLGRIRIELFGSLAATGRGHYTDSAVLLGLAGHVPSTVSSAEVDRWIAPGYIDSVREIPVRGFGSIPFVASSDLIFSPHIQFNHHVNAATITAFTPDKTVLLTHTYFSIGGGFVQLLVEGNPDSETTFVVDLPTQHEPAAKMLEPATVEDSPLATIDANESDGGVAIQPLVPAFPLATTMEHLPDLPKFEEISEANVEMLHQQMEHGNERIMPPYPFATGMQLLAHCDEAGLSIAQIVRKNEETIRTSLQLDAYIDDIVAAMFDCIKAGCRTTGVLPGFLKVPRRANDIYLKLIARWDGDPNTSAWAGTVNDPLRAMDWVNVYALAVNEENAAGHRVVTAPTNGAAGVIPAVLGYLVKHCPEGSSERLPAMLRDFMLAATAIGSLIKTNASIAGAEVGCQGEVGSASSMAAAGLAQAWGGTPRQVENAAEIAMEHNLGLTCDPVGGLVQIPCIERNALAAVKAINAARMAMWGDGSHTVSLDAVIETMYQTGMDMMSKYKETSSGGLAVNVVEC